MKIFNCYVLLPLVMVIGVSKAQNCTNSTSETCCWCTEEQCGDSCLSGFYRLDPPYPSDTGCSLVSTTLSPSSSTDTSNTTLMTPSGDISTQWNNGDTTTMSIEDSQNSTLCLRNCPQGFYGNNDTGACMECSDGCNSCIDNSTCTDCNPGSGTCYPISTQNTTPTSADQPTDNTIYIIIGGVCGGVAVIVIVVVVVIVVICRKRKQSRRQKRKDKTFTQKSEAINQAPTGIESRDVEQEIGKPDHHIYMNTAQLTKGFSTKIQQNHDKLLRYTPDPTQSSNLMSSKDNEQFEVDQLPLAPAPPKTTKSKRLTKVKKPKPEPVSDDVYEPVESVENDTGAHADRESMDGENYENKQVIAQMKSVRKMSHQKNSKDHEEEDYENDLVLKDLKVDSKTEVGQKQEVDPEQEQDYENEEELERLRKEEVNLEAEPEHELQDYENSLVLQKLQKLKVNLKAGQEHELQHYEGEFQLSSLRKPTKDPLTEEEIYQNV